LNLAQFKDNVRDVFEHSYRFQNTEELNKKRLAGWAKLFGSKKLTRVVKAFAQWIDEEAREEDRPFAEHQAD
jgi:hypothetical protein